MTDPIKNFAREEEELEADFQNFEEEPDISDNDEEEQEESDQNQPEEKVSAWSYVLDLVFNIVIIFGIAWFIRMMIVSPFYVDGQSMVPTLENNDFLVVDKVSYQFREPERGDIVVFRPPDNPEVFYVKRVIGLPGETVEFVDGEVRIKNDENPVGFLLDEDYLNEENDGHTWLPSHRNQRIYIPEDRYFLMGDNRNHSSDSRVWSQTHPEEGGTVAEKMIVGRAAARLWIPEALVWKLGLPRLEIMEDTQYDTGGGKSDEEITSETVPAN